ncbi:thiol-disulfide oxidoreductase DCC family protein [Sorangium sp. So ce426]|uniref:thiol-disulfide oxidoreductase DCC family protein n=1 Tax=unclassified Sorangium TaxID=2621164 RepID=UPI003F5C95F5
MIERITVLYDAECALCARCRHWMEHQTALVEMEFLPAGSPEAAERYGAVPWLGEELVVVSDRGEVWAGPAAFIVALWALEGYREWSYRLSGDTLSKMAERFFHALSGNRKWLAGWFGHPSCASGSCRLPGAPAAGPYR